MPEKGDEKPAREQALQFWELREVMLKQHAKGDAHSRVHLRVLSRLRRFAHSNEWRAC